MKKNLNKAKNEKKKSVAVIVKTSRSAGWPKKKVTVNETKRNANMFKHV